MSELFYANLGIPPGKVFTKLCDAYYSLMDYEQYYQRLINYLRKTKVSAEWEPVGYLIHINEDDFSLENKKKDDLVIKDTYDNELGIIEIYPGNNYLLLEDAPSSNKVKISLKKHNAKAVTCETFQLFRDQLFTKLEDEERIWVELLESDDTEDLIDQFFETGTKWVQSGRRQKIEVLEKDTKEKRLCLNTMPDEKKLSIEPNTYVFERQIEAIKALRDAPHRAYKPLIDMFESKDFIKWGDADYPVVSNWYCLTNESRPGTDQQRDFVKKALGTPDYCLLEGPPGSGKTTAIIELIHQLTEQGKKVLLAASTHVAVDNVLERLKEDDTNKDHVFAVRIGDESNVSSSISSYLYSKMAKTERKEILKTLKGINNKRESQEMLLELLNEDNGKKEIENLILQSAHLVCGTTIGILQHPAIKRRFLIKEPLFDYLILDEASKTPFAEFLVPALLAKRWIIVGDRRQLSPYVEEKGLEQNIKAVLFSGNSKEESGKKNETIEKAVIDLFCLWKNEKEILLVQEEDDDIREIYRIQAEKILGNPKTITLLQELEHQVNSMEKGLILANSRIIIGTMKEIQKNVPILPLEIAFLSFKNKNELLKKLYRQKEAVIKKRKRIFRLNKKEQMLAYQITWRIIRDYELRLMPELLGKEDTKTKYEDDIVSLLPARSLLQQSKGNKRTIIDDIASIKRVALPSILEILQHGAGIRRLDRNQKQHKLLETGIPGSYLKDRLTQLTYQHRMHPEISRFPREHIYKGVALNDPEDMREKRDWNINRLSRVTWIQVLKGKMDNKYNKNEEEADSVMRQLKKLIRQMETTPHPEGRPWTIGILTFYTSQEHLIRHKLRAFTHKSNKRTFTFSRSGSNSPFLKVELCTVDRFQGHEADVILLSLVRTRGTGFLDSPNRINVAITRARYQLLIFGNQRFFKDAKKHNSVFLRKMAQLTPSSDDLGEEENHEN